MEQLISHLIGDYFLQSDWMANEKTKNSLVAMFHALWYIIPFILFLNPSYYALFFMCLTHFVVDRFRLVRYVIWLKNNIAPVSYNLSWKECSKTGYPDSKPAWLSVWLMIISDNTLHLACNYIALRYL
jgi:hypothetical protein